MKTLAIYFSPPYINAYPLNRPEYRESYIELIEQLKSRQVNTIIVRNKSYQGSGVFSKYSVWDGNNFVSQNRAVKVDLIYNKDNLNTIPKITDCPIINHPDFDILCRDKWQTFKLFSRLSPHTIKVDSFSQAERAFVELSTNKIVLKDRFGEEGKLIHIITKDQLNPDLFSSWQNLIAQEFIDSSIGIPGLIQGMHDISIHIVGNRPVSALIRQPALGSYLANIAQGGSAKHLEIKQVPAPLIRLLEQIMAPIRKFEPLVFRADFFNSPAGYKLIELNSRPGLAHPNWEGQNYRDFNFALLDLFTDYLSL